MSDSSNIINSAEQAALNAGAAAEIVGGFVGSFLLIGILTRLAKWVYRKKFSPPKATLLSALTIIVLTFSIAKTPLLESAFYYLPTLVLWTFYDFYKIHSKSIQSKKQQEALHQITLYSTRLTYQL